VATHGASPTEKQEMEQASKNMLNGEEGSRWIEIRE
jgi:hypothetical protein